MSETHERRHVVAMTSEVDASLRRHLLRPDGQEDVCFALWREGMGATRTTALLFNTVLPEPGERHVHGNASFEGRYFLRAAQAAVDADAGLALLHSHPGGRGWQFMSHDDESAERSHAPRATVLTGRPLVGLTLAGADLSWSARRWLGAPGTEDPMWVDSVRIVGDQLRLTFNPHVPSASAVVPTLDRTISAWGQVVQQTLSGLHARSSRIGSGGMILPTHAVLRGRPPPRWEVSG